MKTLIEIRPGEGGNDSKLLQIQMLKMYHKYADRHNLCVTITDTNLSCL